MNGCPAIPPCGTETARSTNAVNANSANDGIAAIEGILVLSLSIAARSDKRVYAELRLNSRNDNKHEGPSASYIRPPTAASHLPWSDKGSTRSRYSASRRYGNEQSEQSSGSVRSRVTNCPRPWPPLILCLPPSGNDVCQWLLIGPHSWVDWGSNR